MPVLLALLLGAAVAVLRDGNISGLSRLAGRLAALPLAVLLLPFAGALVGLRSDVPSSARACMTIAAVVPLLHVLGRNTGTSLISAGMLSNAAVIVLNGAMPVSVRAAAASGRLSDGQSIVFDDRHRLLGVDTVLPQLADVIALPGYGVCSLGDLLLVLGFAWVGRALGRPAPGSTRGGRRRGRLPVRRLLEQPGVAPDGAPAGPDGPVEAARRGRRW